MSLNKINPRNTLLIIFIGTIAAIRVFINLGMLQFPMPGFSPLGAMALFGGASFTRQWKALCFPLLALCASDLVLSFTVYDPLRHGLLYGGWFWTYLAFVLMTLSGRWIIKKSMISSIATATFICVFIHWIVSDLGVWYHSRLYAKTFLGFIDCLAAALPFELSFLAGTVIYSTILFSIFHYFMQKYDWEKQLQHQPVDVKNKEVITMIIN
jgi:hypothetical protein